MKDEESELADELFDVVKALVEESIWKVNEQSIRFSSLLQCMSQWYWETKEEFLLNKPGQEWMSFAKACMHYNISLDTSLKEAVRIMAGSSSLEEIRLKFAAAGLLPGRELKMAVSQ